MKSCAQSSFDLPSCLAIKMSIFQATKNFANNHTSDALSQSAVVSVLKTGRVGVGEGCLA